MENEITLSTRWNYVGMKTVLVESECLALAASGSVRFVSLRFASESRVIRKTLTSRLGTPSGVCCCRFRRRWRTEWKAGFGSEEEEEWEEEEEEEERQTGFR